MFEERLVKVQRIALKLEFFQITEQPAVSRNAQPSKINAGSGYAIICAFIRRKKKGGAKTTFCEQAFTEESKMKFNDVHFLTRFYIPCRFTQLYLKHSECFLEMYVP